MGGAASIDRMWRTEGVDWWSDEELSDKALDDMVEIWREHKPNVMVTHDCSEWFAREHMMPAVNSTINLMSRTRLSINRMYAIHAPKIHIFGHWHIAVDHVDTHNSGTRMICLGINQHLDLEI
jgi:hypothetical protein